MGTPAFDGGIRSAIADVTDEVAAYFRGLGFRVTWDFSRSTGLHWYEIYEGDEMLVQVDFGVPLQTLIIDLPLLAAGKPATVSDHNLEVRCSDRDYLGLQCVVERMGSMSDDTAMKALVIEAMYKSLDEQKREALIKGAIAVLITPKEDGPGGHGYYRKSASPLQAAFDDAIQQVARELVFETVRAEGPVRDRIKALCSAALGKLVLADEGQLATELSTAIVRAIRDGKS